MHVPPTVPDLDAGPASIIKLSTISTILKAANQMSKQEKIENDVLEGKTFADRFNIQQRVGSGSFGVTYRAIRTSKVLSQVVALKVLIPGVKLEDVQREVSLQSGLKHPHVPIIYDSNECPIPPNGERRCWVAMQWIQGQTLGSYMKQPGNRSRRSPAFWLTLLRPIFEALDQAHEGKECKRFAHCDISPGNIMIDETNKEKPKAWLLDFGMAKLLEPGQVGGKTSSNHNERGAWPDFMAPEHLTREARTAATDVHALGLILLWLLTGRMPYDGTEDLEAQVKSENRPTPLAKGFDAGRWNDVLKKAVALNPAERYQTAGQFLSALTKPKIPKAIRRQVEDSKKTVLQIISLLFVVIFGVVAIPQLLQSFYRFKPAPPTRVPAVTADLSVEIAPDKTVDSRSSSAFRPPQDTAAAPELAIQAAPSSGATAAQDSDKPDSSSVPATYDDHSRTSARAQGSTNQKVHADASAGIPSKPAAPTQPKPLGSSPSLPGPMPDRSPSSSAVKPRREEALKPPETIQQVDLSQSSPPAGAKNSLSKPKVDTTKPAGPLTPLAPYLPF